MYFQIKRKLAPTAAHNIRLPTTRKGSRKSDTKLALSTAIHTISAARTNRYFKETKEVIAPMNTPIPPRRPGFREGRRISQGKSCWNDPRWEDLRASSEGVWLPGACATNAGCGPLDCQPL